MKLNIDKEIKGGRYYVYIVISELTGEERDKIIKFGSPEISIEPNTAFYKGKYVSKLPLHNFNQTFVFENATDANQFEGIIKNRTRRVLTGLRSFKDNFSKEAEYEL